MERRVDRQKYSIHPILSGPALPTVTHYVALLFSSSRFLESGPLLEWEARFVGVEERMYHHPVMHTSMGIINLGGVGGIRW